MNKICTSIEQSKKLIELGIDVNTADIIYNILDESYIRHDTPIDKYHKPAWSLIALLDIIPKHIKDYNVLRIDITDNDFAIWYDEIGYGVNNDLPNIEMDEPVDACYEMILKLKEQELL